MCAGIARRWWLVGWANDQLSLIVLSAAAQGYSGFFVYSPSPGPGNLVGSWTAAAGTDPYGNAYPAGLSVTDFNFEGSDFIINTAGAFFYEGTPATGNLFVSITTANGTDTFGNAYLSGVEVHGTTTSFATPALVQHVGNSATNVSTLATTIAATGTGNTLIVCVGHSVNDEPVSSVLLSGSADNFRQDFFVNVLNPNIETWSDPGAASGHTTVTVNLAGNDDLSVDVYEFSGLLTPTPLDKTSGNQLFSTGPTWTSNATAATSQAAEVLIGMVGGFNNAGSNPTLTGPAAPWVNETPHFPGSATFMMSGYQVVAATGAYAYAGTSNMTNPNNFYSASIVTYKAAGGGTVETGANIQLTTGAGVPFAFWATGIAAEGGGLQANVQAVTTGSSGSEFITLIVAGPRVTGFTDEGSVLLSSSTASGGQTAGGVLNYTDRSGSEHFLLGWGPNGVVVTSPIVGDTSDYQTERLSLVLGADLPINSTGDIQIFNGATIGVGTYLIEGVCKIAAAAAGVPRFQFTGNTAVATMNIEFTEINEGAPGTLGNVGGVTAFASNFSGATMAGGGRNVVFRGLMIVTTAGLLALQASTSVAADVFTISHTGSYMNIFPVGS